MLTSEPPEAVTDDELPSLKQGTVGELSSVTVEVPGPQVEMTEATLDSEGAFVASGTVSNVLADQEELYFKIDVSSFETYVKNAREPVSEPKWAVHTPLNDDGKPVKAGDKFTVQVFLVPRGYNGVSEPPNSIAFNSIKGIVTGTRAAAASH
jgi:hypothetical protein